MIELVDLPTPLRALFPFQRKYVLTTEEVASLAGKLEGFLKMFQYPRMHLPELFPHVVSFFTLTSDVKLFEKLPFTELKRGVVDFCFQHIKCLEELFVRVVIRNEEVQDALKAMEERIVASDVSAFDELMQNPSFAQIIRER
ncbi:hypothetical protein CAEBREN_24918 [Caenorhabditis brenneri]|uniref:Uncharacterized protein n=1 Tax=Caenorhabditis brenneri TaxID=135651 RepID=G0MBE5_CAEBE|nr:hypothetical protein CAEBREN_24918 [Caenorhabditis brenneri]